MGKLKWWGIAAGLAAIFAFAWYFWPEKKVSTGDVAAVVKLQHDPITRYVDKNGAKHAVASVVTSDDPALIRAMYEKQIDSLVKLHMIDKDELHAFGEVNMQLKGQLVAALSKADSAGKRQFKWDDHYLTLIGEVGDSTVFIGYGLTDTLGFVFRDEHRNLLKRLFTSPRQVLDANFRNQRMNIVNMKAVQIPQVKESRIKVGVYGGYGATLNAGRIIVGPQVGGGVSWRF